MQPDKSTFVLKGVLGQVSCSFGTPSPSSSVKLLAVVSVSSGISKYLGIAVTLMYALSCLAFF